MEVDTIVDGLQVSGIGMGMTSVVLIVLALSVRGMSWIDAYLNRRAIRKNAEVADQPAVAAVLETEESEQPKVDGAARAAAIAVAITLAQRAQQSERSAHTSVLRPSVHVNHDTWLTEGRGRQRANRSASQRSRGRR